MEPSDVPSSERWREISDALDAALDAPPDERPARLDEACAGDAALRREVEEFLEAEAQAPALLDVGAAACASPLLTAFPDEASTPAALEDGRCIGPYRLTGQVGRGGMSTVYRAERADGQFDALSPSRCCGAR